jgi:hypothetical protein
MSKSRFTVISVHLAALAGAAFIAIAAPVLSSTVSVADNGSSQTPPLPSPTPDGHGWVG